MVIEEAMKIRARGLRRSARISELEEKARLLALQKKEKNNNNNNNNSASNAANGNGGSSSKNPIPSSRGRRRTTDSHAKSRGRKRKSLQDVVVSSVASHLFGQEGGSSKIGDQLANLSSAQWMPRKQTLELTLDILQRRDAHEIFAQPVDPKEVEGYYSVIKEPMDFGTMRAKLQEGMYTSLEQFERDVFLIASNAMKFNAPTTIFYSEACALNELAHRVFRSLRNEPQRFELHHLGTRKRDDKRPLVAEAGGSQRTGSKDGRRFNSPEIEKRRTYRPQTSNIKPNKLTVSAADSASKQLHYSTEAGGSYRESLINFSKDLGPAAQKVVNRKLSQIPIEPSYGNGMSLPSTYLRQTPNSPNSCAPFAPQGSAAHLHAFSGDQMSSSVVGELGGEREIPFSFLDLLCDDFIEKDQSLGFVSNAPAVSYKGKMVCDSGGNMNVSNAPIGSYKGKMVCESGGNMNVPNHTFGGEMIPALQGPTKAANISRNMDLCGSSQPGKTVGSGDSVDLLIATIMQIGAKQNPYAYHDYPPPTADENLYGIDGQPSQLGTGFQSWPLEYNKHSQPMWLPPQTTNGAPNTARGTSSFFNGFHSQQYPNGEGPSAIGGVSHYLHGTANYNNIAQSHSDQIQSVHQFQLADWSQQQAPWGLEAICNPAMLRSQVQAQVIPSCQSQRIPSVQGQNASMQHQYQYYPTGTSASGQQGRPLFGFDTRTSFLGGQRDAGSSSNAVAGHQGFWYTAQSRPSSSTPRMNSQQPDLDLQL